MACYITHRENERRIACGAVIGSLKPELIAQADDTDRVRARTLARDVSVFRVGHMSELFRGEILSVPAGRKVNLGQDRGAVHWELMTGRTFGVVRALEDDGIRHGIAHKLTAKR